MSKVYIWYSETIEGLAFAEAKRTELNTSSSRRTVLGLFYYFCVFFVKSSVRFDRTELQNELNMMHSSDEDIELCSVDQFGSIEPNRTFYKKTQK